MLKYAGARPRTASAQRRVASPLFAESLAMLQALRVSRARRPIALLSLALLLVIGATAYGQIALNAWNRPFYDALSRRDFEGFLHQLGVFGLIAGALLVLNVAQTWLNQMTRMKLREGLTRDLFAQWLAPKRAFMLAGAGEIGVNPDQRIHEDTRHLADLTTDLAIGLLQAALLLVSFLGVLWGLSSGVIFHVAGLSFTLPGYMVWSALFYAGAASFASWRVGRPLVGLNARHYGRESDLRFALVHVNDHREGIAVYRGEAEEERRLNDAFDAVLAVLRRLVTATTHLAWVTAGYGWFTIIAPVIVAAPAFFAGDLTIGGLLMSVGAFTQVQQSLRWFVDNAGALADWRATLHRVAAFRLALLDIDRIGERTSEIEVDAGAGDRLVIDDLSVVLPSGSVRLSERHIDVGPGERVLVVGEPGSGKTSLFRAMAGLWPWGSGRLSLPSGNVLFMPKRPFIPDGALRDVLAYPSPPEAFTSEDFIAALKRMGLAHLTPSLDRTARWDQELTDPEQQGLAFARLLLHRPNCVIVDEALEALIPSTRDAVFDVFAKELARASLLCIGGLYATPERYTRVLRLIPDPDGRRLSASLQAGEVT